MDTAPPVLGFRPICGDWVRTEKLQNLRVSIRPAKAKASLICSSNAFTIIQVDLFAGDLIDELWSRHRRTRQVCAIEATLDIIMQMGANATICKRSN